MIFNRFKLVCNDITIPGKGTKENDTRIFGHIGLDFRLFHSVTHHSFFEICTVNSISDFSLNHKFVVNALYFEEREIMGQSIIQFSTVQCLQHANDFFVIHLCCT